MDPETRMQLKRAVQLAHDGRLPPDAALAAIVLAQSNRARKMDDEIAGRVDASWTPLGPQDADALRCAAENVAYISPQAVKEREKGRRKPGREMPVTEALDLLRDFLSGVDDDPLAQLERDGEGDRQNEPHLTRTVEA